MPTTSTVTDKQRDPADHRTEDENRRKQLLAGLPVVEKRMRLAGVSTAVLTGGSGRHSLLLLHGPGEHALKWFRIIPSLVDEFHVVAPDLPGHGDSEPLAEDFDADQVLRWLDELIEYTCPTPPIVVGQTIGGAIALRYAAWRTNRVHRLVLSDSLGLAPFQPTPEFGAALLAYLAQPDSGTYDRLSELCLFDLRRLQKQLGAKWDTFKTYTLSRAQNPVLKFTQKKLMELFGVHAIPTALLCRVTVPTVLLWGRQDLATSLTVAEAASTRYAWPLHIIENAADDPAIEQPDAFVRTLRIALAREPDPRLEPSPAMVDTTEAWDRIAPEYDRTNTTTQMWLGNEALQRAELRPGMRFLDVACGSGALSIPAARIGAEVVAIDQSVVMLRLLRARSLQENLRIESQAMDGHAVAFEGDRFDLVGSQFGVMVFPDMPKAIREMARVTRGGGKVLVIAYGDPHEIDFLKFFVEAIRTVRPTFEGPPMNPPPLPFQLSNPARLRQELEAAALIDVTVETIIENTRFATGGELWDWIVSSNPIAGEILRELDLSEAEQTTVRHKLDEMVRERAGNAGPAVLNNPVNIGIGTKLKRVALGS